MKMAPLPGRWLLRLTLPADDIGRSILGDLLEEYGDRRKRAGPASAWLWFHRQALGVALRQIARGIQDRFKRDGRGEMGQDIRFALRTLRAHSMVHGLVIVVIAVGIAGTALTFGMVNEGLLKALPYSEPGELYTFEHLSAEAGADAGRVSPMDADDLRATLGWENRLATWAFDPNNGVITLQLESGPQAAVYAAVDQAFFPVLGVSAALGRTLGPADNVVGEDAVAVLSHSVWNRLFGADPAVVGRTVSIGGLPFEIVGVLPASFQFPSPRAELFIPATRMTEDMVPNRRGVRYRQALLRVPAAVAPAQARQSAEAVLAGLAETWPDSTRAGPVPDSLRCARR